MILPYSLEVTTMKSLLIMRHAKSSRDLPLLADHDRPLNLRGKKDAPLMGELLREKDLVPEIIISSTATRAVETAVAVSQACQYEGEIEYKRELYTEGIAGYLEEIRKVADSLKCTLIIGHNPDLEELVERLTGNQVTLTTASIALVDLPIERWQDLQGFAPGRLVHIWRPRELD
jgi:phosphohistidine phosphatase